MSHNKEHLQVLSGSNTGSVRYFMVNTVFHSVSVQRMLTQNNDISWQFI